MSCTHCASQISCHRRGRVPRTLKVMLPAAMYVRWQAGGWYGSSGYCCCPAAREKDTAKTSKATSHPLQQSTQAAWSSALLVTRCQACTVQQGARCAGDALISHAHFLVASQSSRAARDDLLRLMRGQVEAETRAKLTLPNAWLSLPSGGCCTFAMAPARVLLLQTRGLSHSVREELDRLGHIQIRGGQTDSCRKVEPQLPPC